MGKVGTSSYAFGQNAGCVYVSELSKTVHQYNTDTISIPLEFSEPGLYQICIIAYEKDYSHVSAIVHLDRKDGTNYAYAAYPAASYIASLNTVFPGSPDNGCKINFQLGSQVADYVVRFITHKITL